MMLLGASQAVYAHPRTFAAHLSALPPFGLGPDLYALREAGELTDPQWGSKAEALTQQYESGIRRGNEDPCDIAKSGMARLIEKTDPKQWQSIVTHLPQTAWAHTLGEFLGTRSLRLPTLERLTGLFPPRKSPDFLLKFFDEMKQIGDYIEIRHEQLALALVQKDTKARKKAVAKMVTSFQLVLEGVGGMFHKRSLLGMEQRRLLARFALDFGEIVEREAILLQKFGFGHPAIDRLRTDVRAEEGRLWENLREWENAALAYEKTAVIHQFEGKLLEGKDPSASLERLSKAAVALQYAGELREKGENIGKSLGTLRIGGTILETAYELALRTGAMQNSHDLLGERESLWMQVEKIAVRENDWAAALHAVDEQLRLHKEWEKREAAAGTTFTHPFFRQERVGDIFQHKAAYYGHLQETLRTVEAQEEAHAHYLFALQVSPFPENDPRTRQVLGKKESWEREISRNIHARIAVYGALALYHWQNRSDETIHGLPKWKYFHDSAAAILTSQGNMPLLQQAVTLSDRIFTDASGEGLPPLFAFVLHFEAIANILSQKNIALRELFLVWMKKQQVWVGALHHFLPSPPEISHPSH